MNPDHEEWKRLPEHKWISNLECYINNTFTKMSCWELMGRESLLNKYKARVTRCCEGTKCEKDNCRNFHSKAEKQRIKQIKENKDDHFFYRDKFFHLFKLIKPFFNNDVASIIRDYCCQQTFQLTKEGLITDEYNYGYRYQFFSPLSRITPHLFSGCVCGEIGSMPKSYYVLTKVDDEYDVSSFEIHKECFLKYFGPKPNLNGWKLSLWYK